MLAMAVMVEGVRSHTPSNEKALPVLF